MDGKPTFFSTSTDFRKWMEAHSERETELWVGYYKKSTKKASIDWPQSVDVGLCFGWIDGIRKSINEESYKIRFTPRKQKSHWSDVNIRRIAELKKEGLVTKAGLEAYARRTEENSRRASFEQDNVELIKAYESKFKANKKAWAFFQTLPPSTRKPSIWWVVSAKQEVTRERRLDLLIKHSENEERIPQLRKSGK